MGVEFTLVNESKRERIGFLHMDGNKARELTGNPAQSAVVTWYLLENRGDSIQFVSDTYDDWPFNSGSRSDLIEYQDVTMKYIAKLIEQGVLVNEGMLHLDEDDPENIYILNLKNVWLKNA